MVLHLSPDLRTIRPLPQTISFVLSGRRTLSEHLPAEVIDVTSTVMHRSDYLRRVILQQGLTWPSIWQFPLPNIDPIGFRMYVEWLQTGRIEFKAMSSTVSSGGLLLRDSFDLIFAHIAGSQLEEPDFQDYIIDTMTKLLDVSQTPDLKVLEVVFLENGASNVLKQFIVDKMFAVERRMLSMIRGRADDVEEQERETGCKYHVHAPGGCYRGHRRCSSNIFIDNSNRSSSMSPLITSSDSPTAAMYGSTMNNMTDDQYFGSAEWSRAVHGLARWNTTQRLHTNKPLPNMSPLTPGSSTTPPLSPRSFPRSPSPFQDRRQFESGETQRLIFECLSRLPAIDETVRSSLQSEPNLHRSEIPCLVLECLERFKNSYGDGASSGPITSTRIASPGPVFEHNLLPTLREQSSPPTPIVPFAEPEGRVHWKKSYDTLPKPWSEPGAQIPNSPEMPPESFTTRKDYGFQGQSPSPVERSNAIPIKRKIAPPRGTDWLKQYDRINDLVRDNSTVVGKRSRRSRFKELLRSESRLGSVALGS
ncbi:hypothetical protein IQ06DRAFT_368244 [Phaeosphaeriaceae sp. SRC1lsM3a]|nr:hypothetical protein IQ06DRAFT_368244 [Stagonospora sp. SRC1lsM3a]